MVTIVKTPFVGGKQLLASEHVQHVLQGATFKEAAVFGDLVAKVGSTGKWEKFVNANVATYTDYGVLAQDVAANGVAGALIVHGSVLNAMVSGDKANFRSVAKLIRIV